VDARCSGQHAMGNGTAPRTAGCTHWRSKWHSDAPAVGTVSDSLCCCRVGELFTSTLVLSHLFNFPFRAHMFFSRSLKELRYKLRGKKQGRNPNSKRATKLCRTLSNVQNLTPIFTDKSQPLCGCTTSPVSPILGTKTFNHQCKYILWYAED
jgi:hypothetical protein